MTSGSADDVELPAATLRAVVVDLGRDQASGARRRLRSLLAVLHASGFDTEVLEVTRDFPSTNLERARLMGDVASGRAVPEVLAWSPRATRTVLDRLRPDIVICETLRCFHPHLLGPWLTHVDFVDRLSVSYRSRSVLSSDPLRRMLFAALSHAHRQAEARTRLGVTSRFAAGRADAAALQADWLPITSTVEGPMPRRRVGTPIDLLFVGTLDYPPNVDAVQQLHDMWPSIAARRPGTTVGVAGARPTRTVSNIARRNGWEMIADFADAAEVYGRARVAIAPLLHASGMQIKVLDAGALGVPQIVSPVVASGFDAELPVVVAAETDDWVREIAAMLDDPVSAATLAKRCQAHLATHYSSAAVAGLTRTALREGASR
jgi:glycosyltransferase involved in cell wall biosynthesis